MPGMLPTLLAYDERMLHHRSALPPHPERPERLQAIMARLKATGLAGVKPPDACHWLLQLSTYVVRLVHQHNTFGCPNFTTDCR